MNVLLSAVKNNLHLTSPVPLLMVVGIVLLYHRRTMVWGRRWLVTAVLAYWALSTPAGSWLVTAPFVAGQPRLEAAADAHGAEAVVVLGAGFASYRADGIAIEDLAGSALRVIEGVRVYRLLGSPLLVVSGGNSEKLNPPRTEAEALRASATALGVTPSRVVLDNESLTTREQAIAVKRLLVERHVDRFVLVTSPIHMRRSVAVFRAAGLDPVPSAARLRRNPDKSFWSLAPDRESLNLSDNVMYECAALVYYWSRGWLTAAAS